MRIQLYMQGNEANETLSVALSYRAHIRMYCFSTLKCNNNNNIIIIIIYCF